MKKRMKIADLKAFVETKLLSKSEKALEKIGREEIASDGRLLNERSVSSKRILNVCILFTGLLFGSVNCCVFLMWELTSLLRSLGVSSQFGHWRRYVVATDVCNDEILRCDAQ